MLPEPCVVAYVAVSVRMRGSSFGTCCAHAKFGLSASSMAAAVKLPTANLAAPSRKSRRLSAPCT